jgi:hypothetical protein
MEIGSPTQIPKSQEKSNTWQKGRKRNNPKVKKGEKTNFSVNNELNLFFLEANFC